MKVYQLDEHYKWLTIALVDPRITYDELYALEGHANLNPKLDCAPDDLFLELADHDDFVVALDLKKGLTVGLPMWYFSTVFA